MADCPSVCEHLHLPVQSGDDAVLRRMGRQYTIEHYLERLARIREAVPGIALSTDVIVGFCGETEAQFEATLRLLETVRYDQVFAAAYSRAARARPATRLADDVPAESSGRRLNELLALQEAIGLERNRAWLGRDDRGPRRHRHAAAHPRPRGGAGRRSHDRALRSARLRPEPRTPARPPDGGPTELVGRLVDRPDRACRPIRPAWRDRRRVTTAGRPPLLVIAGSNR